MDFDKLKITAPYWTNDLPTDAGRWLQYTEGYVCTLLRGVVTFEGDQHTGALPGRLVRNPLSVGLPEGATPVPARRGDETVGGAGGGNAHAGSKKKRGKKNKKPGDQRNGA